MSDGLSAVYQLFERINTYFQMSTYKITGYTLIAFCSFLRHRESLAGR